MYNGDSFGFLFDAPVTDGPYQYMSDPQYVGTTLSLVGTAIYYQSIVGYILAADMYIIFWVSVMFFEVIENWKGKSNCDDCVMKGLEYSQCFISQ